MRRLVAASGIVGALLAGVAAPAVAQYEPEPTTTTPPSTSTTERPTSTTTPGSTTSTPGATTTTIAPEPPAAEASVSDDTVAPGDDVTLTTQPVDGEPAFDVDEPLRAGIATGTDTSGTANTSIQIEVTVDVDRNGTMHVSLVIPEGTPEGLYYVFVTGTDVNGNERVIIVPIVVALQAAGAGGSGAPKTSGPVSGDTPYASAPRVTAPAIVQSLQGSVDPAREAAVVDAVVRDGAEMRVEGDELVLLPRTGSDSTRPLVASASVMLVGGALVLLRRRTATRTVR